MKGGCLGFSPKRTRFPVIGDCSSDSSPGSAPVYVRCAPLAAARSVVYGLCIVRGQAAYALKFRGSAWPANRRADGMIGIGGHGLLSRKWSGPRMEFELLLREAEQLGITPR